MTDFIDKTEKAIKEGLENIPGFGNIGKRFTISAEVDKTTLEDLNANFGINAEEMTKNAIINEAKFYLCKSLLETLKNTPPKTLTLDQALMQIDGDDEVIVSKSVLAELYDKNLIAPFSDKKTADIPLIEIVGTLNNKTNIYLDNYSTFEESKMFIVKENVISVGTASNGLITEGTNMKMLVEGEYTVSSSLKNIHINIV